MKKLITAITLGLTLSLSSFNAQAGGGLSVGAIKNLASGNVLSAAIGGGLGAASLVHGLNLVNNGRIGWGVFFLILEDNGFISTEDREFLETFDIAEQQAFLEIFQADLNPHEIEQELTILYSQLR